MSTPHTITVPRRLYVTILVCLAFSTISHLFRLAVDFIR